MMREKIFRFENEAAMCAAFIRFADYRGWDAYPETGGFDIVLVCRETKLQIGVEAKQQLNVKVLEQAVSGLRRHIEGAGPDFRAVLVPEGGTAGLSVLAPLVGVTVIRAIGEPDKHGSCTLPSGGRTSAFRTDLPNILVEPAGYFWEDREWHQLFPEAQIKLPDYIPDVEAGKSAPIALTEWKVRAIKLHILLRRRGFLSASDFKALKVSSSRWTQGGWLKRENGAWRLGEYMPNFRAQHPVNYDQIEADYGEWSAGIPTPAIQQELLVGASA